MVLKVEQDFLGSGMIVDVFQRVGSSLLVIPSEPGGLARFVPHELMVDVLLHARDKV